MLVGTPDEFVFDPAQPPPTKDQPCQEYNRRMDELIFEILESSFYQKLLPVAGITCTTDLVLMLAWLKADGSAVLASTATGDCAALQYLAFTTVVHSLCLRMLNMPKYLAPDFEDPCHLNASMTYDENSEMVEKMEKYAQSLILIAGLTLG